MSFAVLVVDDSVVSRRMVVKSLPPALAEDVATAANGLEALVTLRERPRGLVLLDLNMPEMDGYQFLEALRGTTLPIIIVLSADIQPKAHERVMALGAKAFIKKPVQAAALAEVLRTCGVL